MERQGPRRFDAQVLRGRFICAVGYNGARFIQRVSGIDRLYQSLSRVIEVTDLSQLPNEAVSGASILNCGREPGKLRGLQRMWRPS
jgi:hypothetical protein